MNESTIFLQLNPDEIAYFKFILEGYDGLASVTTIDRKLGLVALCHPASLAEEVRELLSGLACEITFLESHPATDSEPSAIFCKNLEITRA